MFIRVLVWSTYAISQSRIWVELTSCGWCRLKETDWWRFGSALTWNRVPRTSEEAQHLRPTLKKYVSSSIGWVLYSISVCSESCIAQMYDYTDSHCILAVLICVLIHWTMHCSNRYTLYLGSCSLINGMLTWFSICTYIMYMLLVLYSAHVYTCICILWLLCSDRMSSVVWWRSGMPREPRLCTQLWSGSSTLSCRRSCTPHCSMRQRNMFCEWALSMYFNLCTVETVVLSCLL